MVVGSLVVGSIRFVCFDKDEEWTISRWIIFLVAIFEKEEKSR